MNLTQSPPTITQVSSLRGLRQHWHSHNEPVALVATMGNLHAGHLALVKKAKRLARRVVVSIFVNPLQFGPDEDFLNYPRTLSADIEKLAALDIDAIFIPEAKELYPTEKPLTHVSVTKISDHLCGKSRPGHFIGVATIVTKLFNIVQPQIAVFGEKDYQQLTIIRQLVADLNFPIEIVGHPTVRETDGLAMSSRNQYLSATERVTAAQLYATLSWMRDQIRSQDRDYAKLCNAANNRLNDCGFKVDYIEIRTHAGLNIPQPKDTDLMILAAALLAKTRLIDNIRV